MEESKNSGVLQDISHDESCWSQSVTIEAGRTWI